ncbi:MAG: hypothetical protein CMM94_06340 [Rickettsiales bacterium]|nr:hypothetical protein [Rickettsiales bacterium]
MTELSRSEKILAEKTVCVLLVRGESPDGERIFAYVAVRADKLEEFMKAQQTGTFYPEDYGVVVESGVGDPSAEVRQKMETEYGFNHEGMVDIPGVGQVNTITSDLLKEATKEE